MVVDDLGGAVRNQQRGVRVVSLKIHLGCYFFAGDSYFVNCQDENVNDYSLRLARKKLKQ